MEILHLPLVLLGTYLPRVYSVGRRAGTLQETRFLVERAERRSTAIERCD